MSAKTLSNNVESCWLERNDQLFPLKLPYLIFGENSRLIRGRKERERERERNIEN